MGKLFLLTSIDPYHIFSKILSLSQRQICSIIGQHIMLYKYFPLSNLELSIVHFILQMQVREPGITLL